MNLDAVPPEGETRGLLHLFAFPLAGLEKEMVGMPFTIRAPGIALGDMLHANCTDPVRSDLPTIGIRDVFTFWRFDLQLVSILHINPAIGIAPGLVITTCAHHDELHVTFKIVILFLGDQIMSSPPLSTIGHQHLAFISGALHDLPGDVHLALGPHLPILFDRLHRAIEWRIRSIRSFNPKVLGLVVTRLFLGPLGIGKHSDQRESGTK